MKIEIGKLPEHLVSRQGIENLEDWHSTLLNEYTFTRQSAKFQSIQFWDIWDAGKDEFTGNGGDGYRVAQGKGFTVEGHGEGIRVLVNEDLDANLLLKYLKGLIQKIENETEHKNGNGNVTELMEGEAF